VIAADNLEFKVRVVLGNCREGLQLHQYVLLF